MPADVASITRESPVALLELKLQEWLKVQPEWLLIVAMPRQQRRAAMRELANRLYTIPMMDAANTPSRQVRRKAKRELAKAVLTGVITEEVGQALLEASRQEALAEEATPSHFGPPDPEPNLGLPDPEGDIKADIEHAKEAEAAETTKVAFIEIDEQVEDAESDSVLD